MTTNPTPTPTPPTDRPAEQAMDHLAEIEAMSHGYIMDPDSGFSRGGGLSGLRKHAHAAIAERDALAARCAALYECVLDISDEAFLCGVSGDTSDRIREIEQRARGIMGDADRSEPDRDVLAARCAEAGRKVELYEWMAYQRRHHPNHTDDQLMGLTYVPEWREQAARECRRCDGVGVGFDGRDCMYCRGTGIAAAPDRPDRDGAGEGTQP